MEGRGCTPLGLVIEVQFFRVACLGFSGFGGGSHVWVVVVLEAGRVFGL